MITAINKDDIKIHRSLCVFIVFSMTTFLRHVSTIYANLTALYSIGQSVQVSGINPCSKGQ
jgi:hypothetical protein